MAVLNKTETDQFSGSASDNARTVHCAHCTCTVNKNSAVCTGTSFIASCRYRYGIVPLRAGWFYCSAGRNHPLAWTKPTRSRERATLSTPILSPFLFVFNHQT